MVKLLILPEPHLKPIACEVQLPRFGVVSPTTLLSVPIEPNSMNHKSVTL